MTSNAPVIDISKEMHSDDKVMRVDSNTTGRVMSTSAPASVVRIPARVVQYTRDQLLMIRGLMKASNGPGLAKEIRNKVDELGITATKPVDKTPTVRLISELTEKFQANLQLQPLAESDAEPVSSDGHTLPMHPIITSGRPDDTTNLTSEIVANIRAKREHGSSVGKNAVKSASLRRAAWEYQQDAEKKSQVVMPKFKRSISESGGYDDAADSLATTSAHAGAVQPSEWHHYQSPVGSPRAHVIASRRPDLKRRNTSPSKRHQYQPQQSSLHPEQAVDATTSEQHATPAQSSHGQTVLAKKPPRMKFIRRADTAPESDAPAPHAHNAPPPAGSSSTSPPVRQVSYTQASQGDSVTIQFSNNLIANKRVKRSNPAATSVYRRKHANSSSADVPLDAALNVDVTATGSCFAVIDTSIPSFSPLAVDVTDVNKQQLLVNTVRPSGHGVTGFSAFKDGERVSRPGLSSENNKGLRNERIQRSRSLHEKKASDTTDVGTLSSQPAPGAMINAVNKRIHSSIADSAVKQPSKNAETASQKKSTTSARAQTQFYDARQTSQRSSDKPTSYQQLKQLSKDVRRSRSMKESSTAAAIDQSSVGDTTAAVTVNQSVPQRPRTKSFGKAQARCGTANTNHVPSSGVAQKEDNSSKAVSSVITLSPVAPSFLIGGGAKSETENKNPWENFKNVDPSFFVMSTANPVFVAQQQQHVSVDGKLQPPPEKEKRSRRSRRKALRQITSQKQAAVQNGINNGGSETVSHDVSAARLVDARSHVRKSAALESAQTQSDDDACDAEEQKTARAARNAMRRKRQREKKRLAKGEPNDTQGQEDEGSTNCDDIVV